jgi:hypothetical protein
MLISGLLLHESRFRACLSARLELRSFYIGSDTGPLVGVSFWADAAATGTARMSGFRGAGQTGQLRLGNDHEAALQYTLERPVQRLGIKGGEAFVENDHMRILPQRSCEIETAAFAMRQLPAGFACDRTGNDYQGREHSQA